MNRNIIENILSRVQKPGRYINAELNTKKISVDSSLRVALSFPDLYDIGMSNNAIRIIYHYLNNNLTDTSCERVFMPHTDLENELIANNLPLFTLENQVPVREFDILGFSIGYELLATNILTIIDRSGIPLLNEERSDRDPIIIAGGPASTNPLPFSRFIDFFFIGEFEESGSNLFSSLETLKKQGASRDEIYNYIHSQPYIWNREKDTARRTVWQGFSIDSTKLNFPLPVVDVVQDQGVVEIMRGCPNGCRFCHAGQYYKPVREKEIQNILEQTDHLVNRYGFKEITLSSLSTGDYTYISELVNILNKKYSHKKISFNLPSLKVTSFTLSILEQLSKVRKSGLTFAIETPELVNQRALNKEVHIEQIISILHTAKDRGWRQAKFYFMIGLPLPDDSIDEAQSIADFLLAISSKVKMQFSVNIGTFVPKPHTPYERVPQLDEMTALDTIYRIKDILPRNRFKIGFHSPFASCLEGIISRGDEQTGELLLEGYRRGARLDAWEEYFNRDLWREVLSQFPESNRILKGYTPDETLPWNSVDIGVNRGYFKKEKKLSDRSELTEICTSQCGHNCGVCSDDITVIRNNTIDTDSIIQSLDISHSEYIPTPKTYKKLVFEFCKIGQGRFISNINLYNMLQRVFQIAGVPVKFSNGFNPKAKIELVQPIPLGVSSNCELCKIEIDTEWSSEDFLTAMNNVLPEFISITNVHTYESKLPSLSVMYNSSKYYCRIDALHNKDNLLQLKAAADALSNTFEVSDRTDSSFHIEIPKDSAPQNIYKIIKTYANIDNPEWIFNITRERITTEQKGRVLPLYAFLAETAL